MSLDPPTQDDHLQGQSSTSSTIGNGIYSVAPRRGRLIPLQTKAEVENSGQQTIAAYMVEIPQKAASDTLKAVDALVREHDKDPINLQHLRRIIKTEHVPLHLRHSSKMLLYNSVGMEDSRHASLAAGPQDTITLQDISREQAQPTLSLLVSPTTSIPLSILSDLLTSLLPSQNPAISTIDVPLYPPTSSIQAQDWSQTHWPTLYRKYNPFGPQLSIVEKAEAGMLPEVGQWMEIALRAGKEAQEQGIGVGVGAVIVQNGTPVAATGDARWMSEQLKGPHDDDGGRGHGNPMAHAVMRAIGLVARKRRELLMMQSTFTAGRETERDLSADTEQRGKHFLDKPLTRMEEDVYGGDSIEAGGYLCLDMDMYMTHEPCVMCSMAILHSRFGKAVFGQRMSKTGGLCAGGDPRDGAGNEGGLGYGLFWRQELNWRFLAWRWQDENEGDCHQLDDRTHV